MPAACLALILHGVFLAFVPDLIKQRLPSIPSDLTMTFSTREAPEAEQGPGPEVKHPVPFQEEISPVSETKEEPVVRKPPRDEKTLKAPEKRPAPATGKAPVKARTEADAKVRKKTATPGPKKGSPRAKQRIIPSPHMKAKTMTDHADMTEFGPEPKAGSGPVTDFHPARQGDDPMGLASDLPWPIHQEGPETGKEAVSKPAVDKIVRAVPAYRDNPRPEYPRRARRRGYEGTVILEVLVNRAGKVEDLRVASSSGYAELDRSAMKSVKKWLFEPGSIGGRKVAMRVRVPVRFELRER